MLTLNGRRIEAKAGPLSYLVVEREWSDGDTVSLQLPMRTVVRTWKKNQNAVSVDYGPLSFSLRIGERWQRYGRNDAWPEWEVFPATPWNYGLVLDKQNPAGSFELVRRQGPLARQPFTPGDGAALAAREGQADSRLAAGPLGADRAVAAQSGQIGRASGAGDADSHGRGPAQNCRLSDDWQWSRRPRVGSAGAVGCAKAGR